jgi:nitrite reductase/ring-hydroxylating ferredoxin subunit
VDDSLDDGSVWRCAAGALRPGRTAKFQLIRRGKQIDGFIINVRGRYRAYVNRCPHAGTPLDQWPNEFLADDGHHLVCSTHGAVFDPDSGVCLEGPCPGASLDVLLVESDGGDLAVTWPT